MTAPYILFVDDEEPNLVVFEAVCNEFRVLTANSGEAGLELMKKHEVGVVLSDQRMPRMTGVEFLERVRAEYPDTVRLLITAYSDLQAAEDAINRGHVRRYMRKPWEPESLKAELRDALELYQVNTRMKFLERRLVETERAYALGVAAASVANEIRHPMEWVQKNLTTSASVIATVTSLLGEADPNLTRARGLLVQVEASLSDGKMGLRRTMELVESMSKPPERGEIELVDIAELVRITLQFAERSGLRNNVLLEVTTESSPSVRAPRAKLSQVALNMLANAIQSASNHPESKGVVRIRTSTRNGNAMLEISDNVAEISESDLPSLFDPRNSPLVGDSIRTRDIETDRDPARQHARGVPHGARDLLSVFDVGSRLVLAGVEIVFERFVTLRARGTRGRKRDRTAVHRVVCRTRRFTNSRQRLSSHRTNNCWKRSRARSRLNDGVVTTGHARIH
ncbi:MAG: response regulator [Polyangiales bacterium]